MKKILALLLALVVVGTAEAQVQMTRTSRPIVVCSGAFGWNDLVKFHEGGGINYYLSLSSDNRYDNRYYINLGSKRYAISTLTKFVENFSASASYSAKDASGEPFRIKGETSMGEKRYAIKKDGYAGWAYLRIMDAKKFLKALKKE